MRTVRHFQAAALVALCLFLAACGHTNNATTAATNNPQQAAPAAQQPAADAYQQQQNPQPPSQAPQSVASQPESPSQPQRPQPLYANQPLMIPQGTTLAVRLDETLSSARNRAGDRFSATLTRPIVLRGGQTIPRGTRLAGRVIWARPGGHLKTPAEISIALTSLDLGGRAYGISTSRFAVVGRSHKKHDLKWIAGSAAGGALLGGLIGHGKGVAIGSLIGAGGGTAAAYATGKKEIYLPAETPVRFELRQPVVIARG